MCFDVLRISKPDRRAFGLLVEFYRDIPRLSPDSLGLTFSHDRSDFRARSTIRRRSLRAAPNH